MAVLLAVVPTALNLLLIRTPEQLGQKALGSEEASMKSTQAETGEAVGLTSGEAMKTAAFFLLFAGVLFGAVGLSGYKNYLASTLQSYGWDVSRASTYSSALSFLGSLAIIALGTLAAKIGNKAYICILFLGGSIGSAIIAVLGSNITTGMLIASIIGGALLTPAGNAFIPTVTTGTFGNKDYGGIVTYLMSGFYVGSALTPVIYKFLIGIGWTLSDTFYVTAGCGVLAIILSLLAMAASPLRKMNMVK